MRSIGSDFILVLYLLALVLVILRSTLSSLPVGNKRVFQSFLYVINEQHAAVITDNSAIQRQIIVGHIGAQAKTGYSPIMMTKRALKTVEIDARRVVGSKGTRAR
jgi:hypothetical protein